MVRNYFFLLAFLMPAAAAPPRVRLMGVTPTQALFSYTAPSDAPCQVQVLTVPGLSVVHDFNPALFPGADSDDRPGSITQGRARLVVAGLRGTGRGVDGRLYSRALQANTPHQFSVTCSSETTTLDFTTANVPIGNTHPELPSVSAEQPGQVAWPSISWADRNEVYVDPLSGVALKRASGPGDHSMRLLQQTFAPAWDESGDWTNTAGAISGGVGSLASTTTTSPLFLPLGAINIDGIDGAGYSLYALGVDDLRERLWGAASDQTGTNNQVRVCLTLDSGQSCTGNEQIVTLPAEPAALPLASGFPAPAFQRWGQLIPRSRLVPPTGRVNVTGQDVTLVAPLIGNYFHLDWTAGTRLFIAGSAPACPQELCRIAQVLSTTELRIEESLTLSNAAYRGASFGLRIAKVTSEGTIQISAAYDLALSRMFLLTSNGSNDICSRVPDTTSVTAAGEPLARPLKGHLCVLPSSAGGSVLYFYVAETGEFRLLSNFNRPYDPHPLDGGGGSYNVAPSSFDDTDPRAFYALAETGDGSVLPLPTAVFKGRYTGDYRANGGNYSTIANDTIVWTNLTPGSANQDLKKQLQSLRPDYRAELFPFLKGVGVMGKQYVFHLSAGQDGPCFIGLVNVTTGKLAVKDSWSQSPGRWGVCHTIQTVGDGSWMAAAINPARFNLPGQPLFGPWKTSVTQVFKNGQWSTDTTVDHTFAETCPTGLAATWVALGAAGNNCLRVRVAGEPCSANATAAEKQYYPCPHNASRSMLQTLAEGDMLSDLDQGIFREQLRVVRKTVLDAQTIELVLQRRAFCANDLPDSYFDHPPGWSLFAVQGGGCYASIWWLNLDTPEQPWRLDDPIFSSSHNDFGVAPSPGRYSTILGSYRARFDQSLPRQIGQALDLKINGFPTFSRSAAVMRGDGFIETYPSQRHWLAPVNERRLTLDFRAYQPGLGLDAERPLNYFTTSLQPIPGSENLYRLSSPYSGSDRKRLPYLGWSGRHLLKDKSGPGSLLTDSDAYQFCVADHAGECQPDSTAGQIFVSVPQVSRVEPPECRTNHFASNSPCVITASPVGAWTVQWDLSRTDAIGRFFRRLTMGFSGPGRQYTFSNTRATPDGKWAMVPGYWLDDYRTDIMLMRLPPWPALSSVARHDFVPVIQRFGAAPGLPNLRIRYGYAENGAPGQFFCTGRQETCVAVEPTSLEPFAWAGEQSSGVPCLSGCQLQLSAVSGRVLYYQVERLDETGLVGYRGPLQALAVP